jgi:hypothetical protein
VLEALTVVEVLVVTEQPQLEGRVVPMVPLQQTLEVSATLVGSLDLILQTEACKLLMQQVMQLQQEVREQTVLLAQTEERQRVHLQEV